MTSALFFESEVLDGDILTIVLRGNLDAASTPDFDKRVREHLEAGHSKMIIDCRYLGYISSLGMGSLIALQTRLRRKGGAVKLAAIHGTVMDVLRIVGLDKALDCYGDQEFARKSFYEKG
jgi:anti-anti-sigma factor